MSLPLPARSWRRSSDQSWLRVQGVAGLMRVASLLPVGWGGDWLANRHTLCERRDQNAH